ncbi:MAG: tetratricopeptide repeat protein [Planctomycetota bacterium]|nr:tetratricopeptide repeat protein [Planctomycetota bacterium]
MQRKVGIPAIRLVFGGVIVLALSGTGLSATGASYDCPPGAKFCPVPGRDNTHFIDTHFGLDASTGEVRRYEGTVHPEVANNLSSREEVIYTAPSITVQSMANREVPYPGANPLPPAERRKVSPAPDSVVNRTSEVADQPPIRSRRATPTPAPAADNPDRVPWWKGGVWRNRRSRSSGSQSQARSTSRSTTAKPLEPDDLWGDDAEFDGYGAEGGGSAPSQAQAQPVAGTEVSPYNPYPAPAPVSTGYVTEPYSLPGSPPPTSPYPQGYTYPGSAPTYDNTYQGGYSPPPAAPPASGPLVASAQAPWEAYQSPAPVPPPPSRGGRERFNAAIQMVKDGRFSEAKPILLSETLAEPNNGEVWRWLGDSQYNLLELQDAIGSYQTSLRLAPDDYYALRGQGFSYLHRGHELWRKMMQELSQGDRDGAAATFSQAHENYKFSLDSLGECLRRAPNDDEAIYGEAMAAEGASRKLYSNAISYIKLGPDNRSRAELFAENCLQVINRGVERASDRARSKPGESGPRALLGGLYLRKAMLYHQLGKNELALAELKNSYGIQRTILDEIDKNNLTAQKGVRDCETYWTEWGGTGQL